VSDQRYPVCTSRLSSALSYTSRSHHDPK
jgi:hypothetical protein